MKKLLTIVLAWASLVVMFSFVAASSFRGEQASAPTPEVEVLPARGILTTLRAMGLNPIGEPMLRGPYYVLHAYDRRGVELRVVADAQFGDILSVTPALNNATRLIQRGPRIIHVPQADVRANSRASINPRVEPDASNDDNNDGEQAAPPPRRRAAPAPQRQDDLPPRQRAPRWQPQSETSPAQPSDPRRAVLNAPPPAEGPTPIRPTPRFNAKTDPAGKFGPPPSELPNGG